MNEFHIVEVPEVLSALLAIRLALQKGDPEAIAKIYDICQPLGQMKHHVSMREMSCENEALIARAVILFARTHPEKGVGLATQLLEGMCCRDLRNSSWVADLRSLFLGPIRQGLQSSKEQDARAAARSVYCLLSDMTWAATLLIPTEDARSLLGAVEAALQAWPELRVDLVTARKAILAVFDAVKPSFEAFLDPITVDECLMVPCRIGEERRVYFRMRVFAEIVHQEAEDFFTEIELYVGDQRVHMTRSLRGRVHIGDIRCYARLVDGTLGDLIFDRESVKVRLRCPEIFTKGHVIFGIHVEKDCTPSVLAQCRDLARVRDADAAAWEWSTVAVLPAYQLGGEQVWFEDWYRFELRLGDQFLAAGEHQGLDPVGIYLGDDGLFYLYSSIGHTQRFVFDKAGNKASPVERLPDGKFYVSVDD